MSSSAAITSQASKTNLFSTLPDKAALHIFSFLGADDLKRAACVSLAFNVLSSDFQVWQPKTEQSFGLLVAQGVKQQFNQSWKQTYLALEVNSKAHLVNVATTAFFSFVAPTSNTYIISCIGDKNGRKTTLFKNIAPRLPSLKPAVLDINIERKPAWHHVITKYTSKNGMKYLYTAPFTKERLYLTK